MIFKRHLIVVLIEYFWLNFLSLEWREESLIGLRLSFKYIINIIIIRFIKYTKILYRVLLLLQMQYLRRFGTYTHNEKSMGWNFSFFIVRKQKYMTIKIRCLSCNILLLWLRPVYTSGSIIWNWYEWILNIVNNIQIKYVS